jgi:hypothetical protein
MRPCPQFRRFVDVRKRGGFEVVLMDLSDAELDAATDAYLVARWPAVKGGREAYPENWTKTRERIKLALAAADAERIKRLKGLGKDTERVLPGPRQHRILPTASENR